MTAPSVEDSAALERLRDVLADAGYTDAGIRAVLGASGGAGLGPLEIAVHRRRIRGRDALEVLTALFVLGDSVPAADAQRLLDIDRLTRIGVLQRSAERIRSPLLLMPFEDLIIAGERDEPRDMPADHVPSLHAVTSLVACLMLARGGETLDLGTGSGALALAAAARSSSVTGTDINARALEFARFNALLNGVENVSWVEGSWFEPVRDRRFDTVVFNPPFVMGPDQAITYRDAGPAGADVTRRAVEGACDVLTEGGYATVIGNWVVPDGQDWWDVPIEWTQRLECDMWILHHATYDPLAYAATWNQPLGDVDPAAYEAELDRWVQAHERAGIHTIAAGTMVLRRRPSGDAGWIRFASRLSPPGPAAADQLQRMFAGVDALERLGDGPAIVTRSFRAVDGQRAVETFARQDGTYAAQSARLRMEDGAGVEVEVDPRVLAVIFQCDGTRPLGELVATAAAREGCTEPELAEAAETAVRALVQTGLLDVAD